MRFPTRLISMPAAAMRRLGDTTSDLNSAGQALLSDLQSRGCQQSAQATVRAFQTAWNAAQAATGVPNNLVVDGLYGVNTENALDSWASGQGIDPSTVPAGCVMAAPSGSSSGSSSSTTTTTTTTNNNTTTQPLQLLNMSFFGAPAWLWALGGALIVGVMYEKKSPRSMYSKPSSRRARARKRLRRIRRRRGRSRR